MSEKSEFEREQEFLLPIDGESLVDYVNRCRPKGTPPVSGIPVMISEADYEPGWVVGNWTITVCAETDGYTYIEWRREDDPYWYKLDLKNGIRTLGAVDLDDPWELEVSKETVNA